MRKKEVKNFKHIQIEKLWQQYKESCGFYWENGKTAAI